MLTLATAAGAQDIQPIADNVTDAANDLRGVTFAADGKVYVSGHRGDVETETTTVIGRFNADGTPDASFGEERLRRRRPRARAGRAVARRRRARRRRRRRAGQRGRRGRRPVGLPGALRQRGRAEDRRGLGRRGRRRRGRLRLAQRRQRELSRRREPPEDTAWDLAVDRSGDAEKLVVAGFGAAGKDTGRSDSDRYVARLLAADGSPDPGFNGGAPFSYHSAQSFDDSGRRAGVEADGSIISAGYTNLGDTLRNHVILIRLNPDGTLDESFGGFVEPASSGETVGLTATPGVAVFNPFVDDGGFAECYAAARLSDGSYVTTGYGAATGEGVASTLGFKTTEAQDVVSFRVTGAGLDDEWGHGGRQAIQSEGAGLATAEDRGRHVLPLPGDRTLHVGRYGGLPAAFVLTPAGQLDDTVGENGILELPNDDRRAVLRSGAVARRQARRADNQQQRGRRAPGAPRAQ